MLTFVFEARIYGTLTTTASAMTLRLGGTLMSTSSSATRFRALLVTTVVGATGFFFRTSSGSEVSGVSGSTEFEILRGETEVLVFVVVPGVLVLRLRFFTMAGWCAQRGTQLEDKSDAR